MIRVTATEVLSIMGLTTDDYSDSVVENFIIGANSMVDANLLNKGLSDTILKEIERWITAHLIAVTLERQSKKEGAGGASIEYTGVYTEGLNMTSYGQMAISLDKSGTLSSLTKGKARIFAIPTKSKYD